MVVPRSIRSCRGASIGMPSRVTESDGPPGFDDAFTKSVSHRGTGSEALRQHERRSVRGAHGAPRLRDSGAITRRQVGCLREVRHRAVGGVHRTIPLDGRPMQVSSDGGAFETFFSAKGDKLFYRVGRGVMQVPLTVTGDRLTLGRAS